ncbi:MAG: hypothetical protein OEV59_03520 [Deltaproteobacteria bacterium]|nr:hypothetical protein [Deltaproteobacteria bacterium]
MSNGVPQVTPIEEGIVPASFIEKDPFGPGSFKIKINYIQLGSATTEQEIDAGWPLMFALPKDALMLQKVTNDIYQLKQKNSKNSFLQIDIDKQWITEIKDSPFGIVGGKGIPINASVSVNTKKEPKKNTLDTTLLFKFPNSEFTFDNRTKKWSLRTNNDIISTSGDGALIMESAPGIYRLTGHLNTWSFYLIDTISQKAYFVRSHVGTSDYSSKVLLNDVTTENITDKNGNITGFKIVFPITNLRFIGNSGYTVDAGTPPYSIAFSIANGPNFTPWNIAQPTTGTYHLKHESWSTGHFWEADPYTMSVNSISNGIFGKTNQKGTPVHASVATSDIIQTGKNSPLPSTISAKSDQLLVFFDNARLNINRKTGKIEFVAGNRVIYTEKDFDIISPSPDKTYFFLSTKNNNKQTFLELDFEERALYSISAPVDASTPRNIPKRQPSRHAITTSSGPNFSGLPENFAITADATLMLSGNRISILSFASYVFSYGNDFIVSPASANTFNIRHKSWPEKNYWIADTLHETVTDQSSNDIGAFAAKRFYDNKNEKIDAETMRSTDFAFTGEHRQRMEKPAWITSEKNLYTKLLKNSGPYDILIVPVQVRSHAFDITERSLMTRYLADRISKTTNLKLPNPTYVARALGERFRTFKDADIIKLADAMGVKTVVKTYAGHNREEKMNIDVLVMTRDKTGKLVPNSWKSAYTKDGVDFSHYILPSEVFLGMTDTVIKTLPVKATKTVERKRYPAATPVLPKEPKELFATKNSTPVLEAYKLEFLGSLYPLEYSLTYLNDPFPRAHFFERALVALENVTADSPDYRHLKARALFFLNRRPAAVKALGKPVTTEEKALAALMDGNLPELEKQQQLIKSPLPKLMAYFDLVELKGIFETKYPGREDITSAAENAPGWETLVARRLLAGNKWGLLPSIALKDSLDKTLPVDGYTAKTFVKSLERLNKNEEEIHGELGFSIHKHRNLLFKQNPGKLCCEDGSSNAAIFDYLDLMAAIEDVNNSKEIFFLVAVQGQPANDVLRLYEAYDSTYKESYPMLSAKTVILVNINDATSSHEVEKQRLRNLRCSHMDFSKDICNYSDSRSPYRFDYPLGQDSLATKVAKDKYLPNYDLDKASDQTKENISAFMLKFMYDNTDIAGLSGIRANLKDIDIATANKFTKDNLHRFAGSPAWRPILNDLAKNDPSNTDPHASAEKWADEHPEDWTGIYALATEYLDEGNTKKAETALDKYAGFQSNNKLNPVHISTYAFFAGNQFLQFGLFEQAKKYFTISTNQHTGSQASMIADVYLALLDEDYQEAFSRAKTLSKRYDDYSFEIALSSAIKNPDDTKELFAFLQKRAWKNIFQEHAAHSVIVAMEREGDSTAEILKWAKKHTDNTGSTGNSFFLRIVFLDKTIVKEDLSVLSPNMRAHFNFGNAYYLLKNKEYNQAYEFAQKIPADNLLSIINESLPYTVYAHLKTGKRDEAEKYTTKYDGSHNTSYGDKKEYTLLARTLIAADKGKHDEALTHLQAIVKTDKELNEDALGFFYVFAEVAELLYNDYKKEEYREFILYAAKTFRRTHPYYAWTYAFEAKYTKNADDRLRALAIALYLDRNSSRIAHFSAKEKKEAEEWMKKNNPFLNKAKPRRNSSTKSAT